MKAVNEPTGNEAVESRRFGSRRGPSGRTNKHSSPRNRSNVTRLAHPTRLSRAVYSRAGHLARDSREQRTAATFTRVDRRRDELDEAGRLEVLIRRRGSSQKRSFFNADVNVTRHFRSTLPRRPMAAIWRAANARFTSIAGAARARLRQTARLIRLGLSRRSLPRNTHGSTAIRRDRRTTRFTHAPNTLRPARAVVRRLAAAYGFARDGVHARVVRDPMRHARRFAEAYGFTREAARGAPSGEFRERSRPRSRPFVSDRAINFAESHVDSAPRR